MALYGKTDLLDKLEWEGGLVEVISYGVDSTEVPQEVREDWAEAMTLIGKLITLEAQITEALEAMPDLSDDDEWLEPWDTEMFLDEDEDETFPL